MRPGREPIWPYEEVEEARTLHDSDPEKWTAKTLAEWYGCERSTMCRWLRYESRTGGKLYGELNT